MIAMTTISSINVKPRRCVRLSRKRICGTGVSAGEQLGRGFTPRPLTSMLKVNNPERRDPSRAARDGGTDSRRPNRLKFGQVDTTRSIGDVVVADLLVRRAKPAPGDRIDVVANEPDAAITEQDVDARVVEAERLVVRSTVVGG